MYLKWPVHHKQEAPLSSPIIATRAPPAQVLPEEVLSKPEFRLRGERKWMK
jgi:hypothetical protein